MHRYEYQTVFSLPLKSSVLYLFTPSHLPAPGKRPRAVGTLAWTRKAPRELQFWAPAARLQAVFILSLYRALGDILNKVSQLLNT